MRNKEKLDFINQIVEEAEKQCDIHVVNYCADEENEEPWYESEDCEYCLDEAEESGFEYEHNFTWENGIWVCDQCGQPQ